MDDAMLIQILVIGGTIFALGVCAYYWILASVALATQAPRVPSTGVVRHRFAILIPAHDEEANIAAVLASCLEQDYPLDHYRIFVVADNCTDRTAAMVTAHGATCLERHDVEQPGKGPALAWAIPQVLA